MLLIHLTLANLKMIVRNRQSLFWALAFPVIFVLVFGVFFNNSDSKASVGFIDESDRGISELLLKNLLIENDLDIFIISDSKAAISGLSEGDILYLVIVEQEGTPSDLTNSVLQITLVYDDTNPSNQGVNSAVERAIYETNLSFLDSPKTLEFAVEGISGSEVDYMDFVLPGLALWGVMSFSVIGIATTVSNYREKGIFIRLLATPLSGKVFFGSQVCAYLILAMVQVGTILALGMILFSTSMNGNLASTFLIILVGNLIFLNLGVIVGSFSRTVSAASGLGNAVVLPLLVLSGVFYPIDNLPNVIIIIIEHLPLAPILEILRGIMIESRPLYDFPYQLIVIFVWILATSLMSIKVFRFR